MWRNCSGGLRTILSCLSNILRNNRFKITNQHHPKGFQSLSKSKYKNKFVNSDSILCHTHACFRTITTPVPIIKAESTIKQRSCFTVSPERLQAIPYDICDDNGATSDLSPSSDIVIEYILEGDMIVENQHDRDSDELDGDSHDEGLGDISSDEITESIVHNSEIVVSHKYYNNDNETCEKAMIISAKGPDKNFMKNNENDRNLCQPIKNEKERRPSRISFETPL